MKLLSFDWRGFVADIRHAARLYVRTPTSSGFAIGGLAAAIACVSAMLPLFSDLLLKSHPGFKQSDRFVTLGQSNGVRFSGLANESISRFREKVSTLEVIAGVFPLSLSAELQGKREAVDVELVTRDYFTGLQPQVRVGRGMTESDHREGSEPVAVISDELWKSRFGGRSDAIGQMISISGRPRMMVVVANRPAGAASGSAPTLPNPAASSEQTRAYRIIGVMSKDSSGTFAATTDVWLAYENSAPLFVASGGMSNRVPSVNAIARTKAGVDIKTVQASLQKEFAAVATGPGAGFGALSNGRIEVTPGVVRDPIAQQDAQRQVRLLLAGGVLLALVAAANVSLFLLSRAPGRHRELSIRSAVGASSRRLVRQLATEAAVLVGAATLFGWLLGLWLSVFMQGQPMLAKAQWRTVSAFDWQVLAMISGLALVLTLFVALAPIIGLRRGGIAAGARMLSGQASLSQRLAGIVQISIAGVVVSAALAFGWHLWVLANADVGFSADNVLVVTSKPADPRRMVFNPQENVLRRARVRDAFTAIPGVQSASVGSAIPGQPAQNSMRFAHTDGSGQQVEAQALAVDADYRKLLNMRLLSGSDLDPNEPNGVLVNETFARTMWNRTDVAGEALGPTGIKVLGVLSDASYVHPADKIRPMIFRASGISGPREFVLVKTAMSPAEMHTQLKTRLERGDLTFELDDVQRLDDIWSATLAPDRARSILTSAAAIVVVLLAALGFYSTQSYLVNAGRREYAIRAAVGAGPRALGRLVLLRGLGLGLPGLVLAVLLGIVATAWLRDGFVAPTIASLPVVALMSVALGGLILFTALTPARRARRTAPAPILREE